MSEGKFRGVDFTHEEFCKHFGMSERTFLNRFERFSEIYDINKKNFKRNHEEDSSYFWAVEWAELAGLLIETLAKNPCFRKNAKQEAVTSASIHKYYEELLNKAENEMPDHIREMVKALPSFLATKRLVDKLPILEQKIGELVASLIKVGTEQPGDVLDYVQQTLDSWIYNLHEAHHYISNAKEANKKAQEKELDIMDKNATTPADKRLIEQWRKSIQDSDKEEALALDVEMTNLLKGLMKTTDNMKHWDDQSYRQWVEELRCVVDGIFMQLNDGDDTDLTDEEVRVQRLMYYELARRMSWLPETIRRMSQALVENYRQKQSKSKSRREKVMDELRQAQKNGQPLTQEQVDQMQDYLKFCDEVEDEAEQYRSASQLFIGQLLLPQILRGRKP